MGALFCSFETFFTVLQRIKSGREGSARSRREGNAGGGKYLIPVLKYQICQDPKENSFS